MKFLENKIPPPLVLLLAIVLIYLVSHTDQLLALSGEIRTALVLLLSVIGIAIIVLANVQFSKAQTTINPLKPETASSLVTSGVFSVSRNPMYLGMLLIAFAAGFWFGSISGIVIAAAYGLYLDRFQIQPEERAMKNLFGAEFADYENRVRRWI